MAAAGGVSNIGLGFTFSARDMASGPMRMLSGNFSRLHQSVRSGMPMILASFAALAGSAAVLATGLAGLRGSFALAQSASDFGLAMADVGNISQATGQALEDLTAAAIRAGIETQFSPTEAAEGLRNLASNGMQAADSITALIPVLDLAASTGIEVSSAADVVAASLNAYGLEADQATIVTDRLVRATQLSALRADEFETIMGRAMATGRMYGQSMNDVVIALGSMRSAGIPATVAVTSYGESARRAFTDPNSLKKLQELGVAIETSTGSLRPLHAVMFDVRNAMNGMTEAEKAATVSRLFGIRGMQSFNAMANIQARVMRDGELTTIRGAEAIAHYTSEMDGAAGTAASAREARLRTFWGALELLGGTVKTLGVVIGSVFGSVFRPAITLVTNTLNAFIRAWEAIPDGFQSFISVAFLAISAFATIGGGVGVLVAGIGLLIGVFGEVLLIVGAVAAAVVVALLPVFAAFGALIAVGYAVYRAFEANLGGLRDWFNNWSVAIGAMWTSLVRLISGEGLDSIMESYLVDVFGEDVVNFMFIIQSFAADLRMVWASVQEGFSEAWDTMFPVFSQLVIALEALGSEVYRTLSGGSGSLMNAIRNMSTAQLQEIGTTIGTSIVGALRLMVSTLTLAVGLFRLLIAGMRIAWPAVSMFFGHIAGTISQLVGLFDTFQGIMESLNPAAWIGAGLQALRGEEVTTIPLLNNGERLSTSERIAAYTGSELAVQPRTSTADDSGAGLDRLRGSGPQIVDSRPVRTNIDAVFTAELDGREIWESRRRYEVENQASEGDVGAWAQPVTVWED